MSIQYVNEATIILIYIIISVPVSGWKTGDECVSIEIHFGKNTNENNTLTYF